jgi:hypothetical protein
MQIALNMDGVMESMKNSESLYHLIFGEHAETARNNAGERLQDWARLFEGWLDGRKAHNVKRGRFALRTWRCFLALTRRPPWEAGPQDV